MSLFFFIKVTLVQEKSGSIPVALHHVGYMKIDQQHSTVGAIVVFLHALPPLQYLFIM